MSHAFAAGNQNERSSFFKDIKQFPPGHYAFLEDDHLVFTEYWDIPIAVSKNTKNPEKELKETFTQSVKDRIPDELPTAIALSSGLDSSIVASIAVNLKGKKDITAFVFGILEMKTRTINTPRL